MYQGPQRKLNRNKNIDYSLPGFYYLTICTKHRIEWFGNVTNKKMILNEMGRIVDEFWKLTPKFYKNILLNKHIIMPNHIHGIIQITKQVGNGHCPFPTNHNYGLISKIINSYKNVCTKHIRYQMNTPNFQWQNTFYDRLLRNQTELNHARWYINNNPKNWGNDRNN